MRVIGAHGPLLGRPIRGPDLAYFDGGFAEFLQVCIRDTVEMPVIPEAEGDVPVLFEPGNRYDGVRRHALPARVPHVVRGCEVESVPVRSRV